MASPKKTINGRIQNNIKSFHNRSSRNRSTRVCNIRNNENRIQTLKPKYLKKKIFY